LLSHRESLEIRSERGMKQAKIESGMVKNSGRLPIFV
jgi:hypothetical protein